MARFYKQLDGWFRDYYEAHPKQRNMMKMSMFKQIYSPAHYVSMENLYLAAKKQPMTDKQARRLQLIGDNLIILQWRLRNAGILASGYQSDLTRDDKKIRLLLEKQNTSFPMFPGIRKQLVKYISTKEQAVQ